MNQNIYRVRIGALFLVSVISIAYELAVMRIFAVGSWSNFGSLVIGIALLGIGFAGTLLTFLNQHIHKHPEQWLLWPAILLGPTMAAAHIIAQYVPFNPVMIGIDWTQVLWIASYYIIYAVPFFVAAIFIGVSFVEFQDRLYHVYFWNMFGSGVGGILILFCMYVLPPDLLIEPLIILAALAALLCAIQFDLKNEKARLPKVSVFVIIFVMIISLASVALGGKIKVSEFKPISYARQFPDATLIYHSYGPTGEYDVYQSSYFHFAPGLSDNASFNVASMPENAFLGLYIDGQGPIGIMRKLHVNEEAYIDYLPMAAPYTLLSHPSVLILGLGGGIGVANALYHNATNVSVAEPDTTLVHILKDNPIFRSYTGDLLNDPRVQVQNIEPRAFSATTKQRFDMAEIGLIDSVGLSETGGYQLNENYTYTAEGINSYINTLNPNGILSITVWNRLDPPRNVPKLLTTVVQALRMRGVQNPGEHIFVFDSLLSTATILVKNSAFTQSDITTLLQFLHKTSFVPCYYPGMPDPGKDFGTLLASYTNSFSTTPTVSGNPESAISTNTSSALSSSVNIAPEDIYYYTIKSLLSGNDATLYAQYPFNILPATDDRPYYTGYLKPSTLPVMIGDMKDLSEEWGYVFELGTLAMSLFFGFFIVLIPLVSQWRELFKHRKGTLRVIAYYAALGVGYMLVEIYLMQRFVYFLDNPIFSSAVVITAMLILSGLGALFAGMHYTNDRKLIRYAFLGITLSVLFYITFLPQLINGLLILPLVLKMILTVCFIAPSAFFLGIPFPTGLSNLSKNRKELIPWAWGMNGALAVTGAALARLVSLSWGFTTVLILTIVLYGIVYLTFSANQES